MPSRKRKSEEIEERPESTKPNDASLRARLRNMWEFAALIQYIYIFGNTVKIDKEVDVEVRTNDDCTQIAHDDADSGNGMPQT